jgi:putative tryptophan/tyrosine transport system substrate-binding protein
MNPRRKLLAALGGGALAAPFGSFAQQQRSYRIGVLSATFTSNPLTQAFVQELQRLGYTEGQNILIVDRIADGNLQGLPAFAAELVAERVDVIFADSTNAARAARQATASILIVFSTVSEPPRHDRAYDAVVKS